MKRAICLLACWLAVLAAPASAEDWHDQSHYPARVIAFTWGDGSAKLDSNHPAIFGSWTVSFSPQTLPLIGGAPSRQRSRQRERLRRTFDKAVA
jgi:hypothetical protein